MATHDEDREKPTDRLEALSEDGTVMPGSQTYFDPDTPPFQGAENAAPAKKKPVLITLDGRRVSERFVLEQEKTYLGRDVHADIKVADGEVSRRHSMVYWSNFAKVYQEEPTCKIYDCRSTNGTFLNNEPVGNTPRALYDGDLIRLGKTVLGFFLKDERVLELDQLLLNMALHDTLTGLYKREYFFSELHREYERSKRHDRPLSVGLIDIDFFKSINDDYGHLRGDEALRRFSDLLRLSLREGDICGRYGGEEFAVVLPETDLGGAVFAMERFRRMVEESTFDMGEGRKIHVTCSCGVATLRNDHRDKMHLLDDADRALYSAKSSGRNRTMRSAVPLEAEGSKTKQREESR